ncbi:hypothetical protein [Streptacidiphilus jiangxiensis]|uniref:DUF2567 domain-containing protein n=1 Tax=Streptacidiphilus jiangxiensis TaxID=235985 RepID=A0A1H7SLD0_STRJI|nr:hypothetical protein [Streptacidiphilus jiangxiensis]SEL73313.1 hypothetical protein SAMN05414137_11281 [Streptacidiphilus jiangxiensis]
MTAPNAPEGHSQPPSVPPVPPGADQVWAPTTDAPRPRPDYRREILVGLALVVGSAVAGVLFGLLWHAVAPRVPLYSDGTAVYLRDPEGEQQIAADGWFALIGGCFGVVTAALAYWLTRRRGAGLAVPIGLTLGGLAAGWVAWQLGTHLGQTDILKLAATVPKNTDFSRPLQLGAKTAIVAWPMAALLTFLAATALFTPKDEPHLPHPLPPQPPLDPRSPQQPQEH